MSSKVKILINRFNKISSSFSLIFIQHSLYEFIYLQIYSCACSRPFTKISLLSCPKFFLIFHVKISRTLFFFFNSDKQISLFFKIETIPSLGDFGSNNSQKLPIFKILELASSPTSKFALKNHNSFSQDILSFLTSY